MSYTTSSLFFQKDLDTTPIIFCIDNFAHAKNNKKTGQSLNSETFSMGASMFYLRIYPSGKEGRRQRFYVCVPHECQRAQSDCQFHCQHQKQGGQLRFHTRHTLIVPQQRITIMCTFYSLIFLKLFIFFYRFLNFPTAL